MRKVILAITLDSKTDPFISVMLENEANDLVQRWMNGKLPPIFGSIHIKTQQDPTMWAVRTERIIGMTVGIPQQSPGNHPGTFGGLGSGLN